MINEMYRKNTCMQNNSQENAIWFKFMQCTSNPTLHSKALNHVTYNSGLNL